MSLTSVKMSEEVWFTCLTHAMSTEKEEIMGLLFGDIQTENGHVTAMIWGASPQKRSDRRKDRVETNPEQLAAASAQAERMSTVMRRTTRVIGWYHSHPHITVFPSHIDTRTQAMYQLLDPGFVGLIFSCFNEDSHKVGRIQVVAFQSFDGKETFALNPTSPSLSNRSPIIDVDSPSDGSTTTQHGRSDAAEQDTDASIILSAKGEGKSLESFFTDFDSGSAQEKAGTNSSDHNLVVDIDPMDFTENMEEVVHHSNLEISAEYNGREIPLHIVPVSCLVDMESPLESFVDLQRVLYEEEKEAYSQAILQTTKWEKVHPITFIHHTSIYQASLCKLMEYCLIPAITALQDRLNHNKSQRKSMVDVDDEEEEVTVKAEGSSGCNRQASGSGGGGSPVGYC